MRNARITCVSLLLAGVLPGCSSSKSTPVPGGPPGLWGDLKPVVSVKELMHDLLDPISDNVFEAVSIVVDKNGRVEKIPRTPADWDRIRTGGVGLAEGAYLLKVRRPLAPAGDVNNSTGLDAVELSPDAITAKIEKDPVEWNARIEALRNVGLEVMDIVRRKDVQELWDASENLEAACESCHRRYWYPGENAAFYSKLEHRLQGISRSRSLGSAR
jgi:cytochrome c556